jgi:hypothetical protein
LSFSYSGTTLKTYKYGVKTLYYHTTRDGSGEEGVSEKEDDNACADGVCRVFHTLAQLALTSHLLIVWW